jgi:hypothetical protein
MALTRARRPQKQGIFTAFDEPGSGQIEDQTAVHLGIEGKVEVVERLLRVAKLGLLAATFQQAITAPHQFVGHQCRDQVDGRHGLGLGLVEASFQDGGHPSQPQLS